MICTCCCNPSFFCLSLVIAKCEFSPVNFHAIFTLNKMWFKKAPLNSLSTSYHIHLTLSRMTNKPLHEWCDTTLKHPCLSPIESHTKKKKLPKYTRTHIANMINENVSCNLIIHIIWLDVGIVIRLPVCRISTLISYGTDGNPKYSNLVFILKLGITAAPYNFIMTVRIIIVFVKLFYACEGDINSNKKRFNITVLHCTNERLMEIHNVTRM